MTGLPPVAPDARIQAGGADPESAHRGPKWTCSRCRVVSLNAPSHVRAKWQRDAEGGMLCPGCVATRAASEARDAARAELIRDPEATDREIADRVGAAGHESIRVREVSTVRRELIVEGVILSPRALAKQRRKAIVEQAKTEVPEPEPKPARRAKPKPKPPPRPTRIERYPEIVAELRRDPQRRNMDIAHGLGLTNEATTRRVRWALEAAGEIEVYRGNGRAAK